MKRHNARIIGVMVVFSLDINQELQVNEIDNTIVTLDLFKKKLNEVESLVLDDEYGVEIDNEYLNKLITHLESSYARIISLISSALINWTIDRLSYVDRAIMICACCEMMMNMVPKEVIINEYLDITREYSMIIDEKQVKFNNKVLENIASKVYEQ